MSNLNAVELAQQLTRGSVEERQAAAGALRQLGAPAVEPLCELLKHDDPNVRAQVAAILGDVGVACAVKPLLEALQHCFAWERAESGRWMLVSFVGMPLTFFVVFTIMKWVLPDVIDGPLPSDSPEPDIKKLPIPARTPAPDAATLPRAAQPEERS
jgi:hypothetical protein